MLRLAFTFLFAGGLSAILGFSGASAAASETVQLQVVLSLFVLFIWWIASTSRKATRFKIIAGPRPTLAKRPS